MGKSARALGEIIGLTAQEVNHLLKEEGFLQGKPGDYELTEKGLKFAKEVEFHRGTGGYAHFNRYWTERTWDEGILNYLPITPERLEAVRESVKEARRNKFDTIKINRDEADAAFRSMHSDLFPIKKSDSELPKVIDSKKGINGLKTAGKITLGTALLAAGGYLVYKAAPHIKKWWKEKVAPAFDSREGKETEETEEEDRLTLKENK